MAAYRVYALDARDHIKDLVIIERLTDAEALREAGEVARQRRWRKAEVWLTSRLIGRLTEAGTAR
jgi:hypothetical protein